MNAPQYHWHVQGVVGADDEARQHIVALAQRLHQFGHRTEERELELWHRLSNVADVAGVERRLATTQETWESEYNKFIAELSSFVNKEISEFRQHILSVGESTTQLQCNVCGISVVSFSFRSRTHCACPIRTNMYSTP